MTDHADTIRRHANTLERLGAEFASTDPSDVWTQAEVYEHVYAPLCDYVASLLAERQQAIDERDDCVKTARERIDGLEVENERLEARAVVLKARCVWTAEARCEQAIDALREAEQWAFELGHEGLAERLRAALVSLGETEQ